MIKIPADRYGNTGWAVKARKAFRCEIYPSRDIQPGEYYYRAMAWPGSDVNPDKGFMVMRICRDCLNDEHRMQFDVAVNSATQRI
ncbi:hypothetical protein [Agreia sp. COWG]|uniref:hypothetical protein n=1 Tax=Agreia sp. COWG TaxID=2773266 RepID=UPI0019257AF2|nr:hypothetical protein [Agreia sp. COWG]CAD5999066.1 conserved protein of unknown function [Agreia sp. COWG]